MLSILRTVVIGVAVFVGTICLVVWLAGPYGKYVDGEWRGTMGALGGVMLGGFLGAIGAVIAMWFDRVLQARARARIIAALERGEEISWR